MSTSDDSQDKNLAETTLRLLKQSSDLEKERDRYKHENEVTKMRLEIAERKLADIEQHLVFISPPRTGSEAIGPRVGELVVQLREQQQLTETLKNSRRDLNEQRARWEQIVDRATTQGALRLDDPAASAQAVALYADQVLAEAAARFQAIPMMRNTDEKDVPDIGV